MFRSAACHDLAACPLYQRDICNLVDRLHCISKQLCPYVCSWSKQARASQSRGFKIAGFRSTAKTNPRSDTSMYGPKRSSKTTPRRKNTPGSKVQRSSTFNPTSSVDIAHIDSPVDALYLMFRSTHSEKHQQANINENKKPEIHYMTRPSFW